MAFPKKGLRKITIDGVTYAYNITGNDDYISFSIGLHNQNGEILTGGFSYHSNYITNFERDGSIGSWTGYQRIKVTPDIIRQVIEYGLENGWNPQENKGQMRLWDLEKKIKLNLKAATTFPDLKNAQVALFFAKLGTGHALRPNKDTYEGEGDVHLVFDTLEDAKAFANKNVKENQDIECWILTEKDKAVFYINADEEKVF